MNSSKPYSLSSLPSGFTLIRASSCFFNSLESISSVHCGCAMLVPQ